MLFFQIHKLFPLLNYKPSKSGAFKYGNIPFVKRKRNSINDNFLSGNAFHVNFGRRLVSYVIYRK